MHKFPLDIASGSIAVDVYIKGPVGSRLLRMALDTGATFTIIPFETAIAVGCDPAKTKERIEFITPSGTEYSPIVIIPMVKAFGFEVKNIKVFCHNLPPQSPVEGLLGLNFLKNFNILLRFREKIIEITE
jgi:clan AA aspartic protease (TIGR02281 family)